MIRSRLLLFAACAAVIPGCSTTKAPIETRGTITVKVLPYFGKAAPVHISIYAPKDGKHGPELFSYIVKDDGITGFVVPMGRTYEVHAFADLDRDGKQGAAEPAAILENLQPDPDVTTAKPPVILTLPGTGSAPDWPTKPFGSAPAGPAANTPPPSDASAVPAVPPPP